jgi:hypothetical protein
MNLAKSRNERIVAKKDGKNNVDMSEITTYTQIIQLRSLLLAANR